MAVNVYKLNVAYEGLENKIWRDIEVSGNYTLKRLGYCVLATFDTMAYHLFEFEIHDEKFVIPDEEFNEDEEFDMAWFKLSQFKFNVGDRFIMDYDFGTTQTFVFTVAEIRPLEKGGGRAYPKIVDGAGCGIIDDMLADELSDIITQLEKNKPADKIYYKNRPYSWDFRSYDIEADNALLKGEIELIEDGYSGFWEDVYGDE